MPAISSFQPSVTPKGTTATIARGTASSRTFTVQNVGSLQATYSLAVACGGMTGCSANKSTTTLDPGATDNVVVNFTTPTTFGASNAATLTATYTNANNQSIADNASVTVTTPVGQPSVAPKAGAAVTQQDGDLATFQVSNTGTALAQFSFAAACDTWAVSCYVWDVPTVWIGPNETVDMHVAFSGGAVLGSPTASPAHVRLIASLAADGAVVAVDTGTVSATRAYYKVNFASKTIAVTDSAIFGQTKTVTLTNTGNAAAYYSIAITCTGVSGCSGPPSVWLLPGVATTFSYFHNGPAHVGQSGTIRFVATRAGGPAPADADTAVVTATAGDFLPPQVQIWQPGSGANGSVVTSISHDEFDRHMQTLLDVPEYDPGKGLRLEWDAEFEIRVMIADGAVVVTANPAGLRSLARHLLALAQAPVPSGTHVHLDSSNSLEDGSQEFVIQRV